MDGLDLLAQKDSLVNLLNDTIDRAEIKGIEMVHARNEYDITAKKRALAELAAGSKATFITQFIDGYDDVSEKKLQKEIAEVEYKTLNEKINAVKLQLRIVDAQATREWSRYSDY